MVVFRLGGGSGNGEEQLYVGYILKGKLIGCFDGQDMSYEIKRGVKKRFNIFDFIIWNV